MQSQTSVRRCVQVWDSLMTGDMRENGMGDCNGTTAVPPPGRARPTPPSFAIGPAAASVRVAVVRRESGSVRHGCL